MDWLPVQARQNRECFLLAADSLGGYHKCVIVPVLHLGRAVVPVAVEHGIHANPVWPRASNNSKRNIIH